VGLPSIDLQCRNDEIMPRLAEAIQAMWLRQLGVHTTITQVEQKTWIQNQQTLNYGISTAAWTADFPDPVTFLGLFTSDSSYNWTGWKNPAYDRLLSDAANLSDQTKRLALFQQAEALLLSDTPVTPIHYGALTYLIHPAVHGWDPAPLVFRRFQKVSLEP
jgi:oligopeptide transport system substrate-binding protein